MKRIMFVAIFLIGQFLISCSESEDGMNTHSTIDKNLNKISDFTEGDIGNEIWFKIINGPSDALWTVMFQAQGTVYDGNFTASTNPNFLQGSIKYQGNISNSNMLGWGCLTDNQQSPLGGDKRIGWGNYSLMLFSGWEDNPFDNELRVHVKVDWSDSRFPFAQGNNDVEITYDCANNTTTVAFINQTGHIYPLTNNISGRQFKWWEEASEYGGIQVTTGFGNPHVAITSPDQPVSVYAGSTINISGYKAANGATVSLYRQINGNEVQIWGSSTPIFEYSYNWTIPTGIFGNCLIRAFVSNPTGNNTQAFSPLITILQPTITVTSPNGGEMWTAGYNRTITWSSTGNPGNVKIECSTNSGTNWVILKSDTPNDGSEQCTMPNVVSTETIIRISSVGAPTINDVSDNAFVLKPNSSSISGPSSLKKKAIGTYSANVTPDNYLYTYKWFDKINGVWYNTGKTTQTINYRMSSSTTGSVLLKVEVYSTNGQVLLSTAERWICCEDCGGFPCDEPIE